LNPIIILTTINSKEEAEKISRKLLKEKLVACVNIIGPIESLFWWQNKIDEAEEFIILIKTDKSLFQQVAETTKKIHPYQIPEIIGLPIVEGSKDYLRWMYASLTLGEKNGEKTSP